jgi:flavodoxin I
VKALVVYDTRFGNTEAIAQAIGEAIEGDTAVIRVTDTGPTNLESVELFIVGSPTQGARHTLAVQNYLDSISEGALKNVGVAAFDTRYSTKSGGLGTRLIARMAKGFGFAAPRIADILKEKGGKLLAPPEGFIVNGTKGPLKDGELERAAEWAEKLAEEVKG